MSKIGQSKFSYRHKGYYFTTEVYQQFGMEGAKHKRWKFAIGFNGEIHSGQDFILRVDAMRAAVTWIDAHPREAAQ